MLKTEDIITVLQMNQIRGAALDVTDRNRLPKDHPLWKVPSLIITPHTSGHSIHFFEGILAVLDYNLAPITGDEAVINNVDRGLTYWYFLYSSFWQRQLLTGCRL